MSAAYRPWKDRAIISRPFLDEFTGSFRLVATAKQNPHLCCKGRGKDGAPLMLLVAR